MINPNKLKKYSSDKIKFIGAFLIYVTFTENKRKRKGNRKRNIRKLIINLN